MQQQQQQDVPEDAEEKLARLTKERDTQSAQLKQRVKAAATAVADAKDRVLLTAKANLPAIVADPDYVGDRLDACCGCCRDCSRWMCIKGTQACFGFILLVLVILVYRLTTSGLDFLGRYIYYRHV